MPRHFSGGRAGPRRDVFPAAALLVAILPTAPGLAGSYHSVAMHMHGSMSEGLGSMRWHAERALATGVVDVIWWTDHDWRAGGMGMTRRYDFENAFVDGQSRVTEPDAPEAQAETRYWEVRELTAALWSVSVVDSMAIEGIRSLRMTAAKSPVSPDTSFQGLHLAQTGSRKHNRWSLAHRVRLSLALYPESLPPLTQFVVNVRLSDQTAPHELRYVAGSADDEPATTILLPVVEGSWNTYTLDVFGDAVSRFSTGGADTLGVEDHSLYEVTVGVETKSSAVSPVVFLDDYRILPDSTLSTAQAMERARAIVQLYDPTYPALTQFVGSEISWFKTQPHLNGYAPDLTPVDYTGRVSSDSIHYAVDHVHGEGGAVSLNHVFGTAVRGNPNETPQQRQARIDYWKRTMISSRVYGADLLEVGYRRRQGMDLGGHLETWDAITGNAIFLTANGVTDSHGSDLMDGWGTWQPGNDLFENNFVTWLYAEQLNEQELVAAMKSGRAFFGDPFVFGSGSRLELMTAEGFPIGRVVVTDRASHDVVVAIDALHPALQVRLLQGEIRENPPAEYIDVHYLRDEVLSGTWTGTSFVDTVTIDTTVPSFVRVEVDSSGTAAAFSNPVHFLRQVPASGVAAPRVAAAIGPVLLTRSSGFALMDIRYLPGASQRLEVDGDEETTGSGVLEFDVSALGEPDAVLGGGTTSYDYQNGILELGGFTGTGSTLSLLWGENDAAVVGDRIQKLALSVGRPNPFGEGCVTELALPRRASAFLEVLDVRGRRVRLLLDEPRPAGIHRIAWDGRDTLGHAVPAGVYFFRLTVQGQALVRKAVRIR